MKRTSYNFYKTLKQLGKLVTSLCMVVILSSCNNEQRKIREEIKNLGASLRNSINEITPPSQKNEKVAIDDCDLKTSIYLSDCPLNVLCLILSRVFNKNIVVSEKILKKTITVDIKNECLEYILNILSNSHRIDYIIEGQTYILVDKFTKVKTFKLNYLQNSNEYSSETNFNVEGNSLKNSYKVDSTLWDEINSGLNAIINNSNKKNEQCAVNINRFAGIITVKAPPYLLREVEKYIKEVKEKINSQILLEIKIIHVENKDSDAQSLDWSFLSDAVNLNNLSAPQSSLISNQVPEKLGMNIYSLSHNKGYNFILNFLEKKYSLSISYNAEMRGLHNHQSIIKVGGEESYLKGISSLMNNNINNNTITNSFELKNKFTGMIIAITPVIHENNSIHLNLNLSINNIFPEKKEFIINNLKTIIPAYREKLSTVNTTVSIPLGGVALIGGLKINKALYNENKNILLGIFDNISNYNTNKGFEEDLLLISAKLL